VIALRDAFLTAWQRYRAALDAVAAAGSPDAAADRRKEADVHAAKVRALYADLISQARRTVATFASYREAEAAASRSSGSPSAATSSLVSPGRWLAIWMA
jgi:hypothetical protein